ncbi:MAG: TRAP transporter small permease subunit [Burkholderiaceae bacterium]
MRPALTMRQAVVRFSDRLDAMLLRLATAALALLVAVVLLQVVARYVFFQPPVWTEEMARYLMIWAGLLGATLSFKRVFDPAVVQPAGQGVRARLTLLLQSLAVLVFVGPALFFSFFGPNLRFSRGYLMRHARTLSETLDVPTLYVAIAVPLALAVILVHLLARWCAVPATALAEPADVSV